MALKLQYKNIPLRVIRRYWLFQIPGFIALTAALYIFLTITRWPWWIFCIIFSLWLIKDIILLPITWRSYDMDQSKMHHSMNHRIGIVKKELNPEGIIQIGIEKWNAKAENSNLIIAEGEEVIVLEQNGMKLTVSQRD